MTNDTARAGRGHYLIKGGAVITVDEGLGTLPRADLLVRDGVIEKIGAALDPGGAEIIDAADMIVMPGLIDSHYHMWSTLGRNFIAEQGFEYFQAKWATSAHYNAEDFYNSVSLGFANLAHNGVTTVHNWAHNNQSPQHVDAELRAHSESGIRARYSFGQKDLLPRDEVNSFADLGRVRSEWFADPSRFDGLVHLGVTVRGMIQSEPRVFHEEMQFLLKRGLAVSMHASQGHPNSDDAADYERRGYLGPKFLFCHYIAASDGDREAMARTKTPLSFSTHSELRLSQTGDARTALMKVRAAGVSVTLSSDAPSIASPNMLEIMRFTWNMGRPWRGTDTETLPLLSARDVIAMATINGARALGLGDITGSLTPGKRADLILIRANDLNVAPLAQIETTVVMSATPENVDTVMVDGRIVKRHGRLLGYDIKAIVERAKRSSLRVRTAAGGIVAPVRDAHDHPLYGKAC